MNTIAKTLLRLGAVVAMTTGFALAQPHTDLTASIPFNFNVGKTMLPAGEYTITSDLMSSCLQIRDSQNRVQAMVITFNAEKPSSPQQSQMVFRVYGDRHYLASTWNGSMGLGRELQKTPAEREAELSGVTPTRTVLIARK